MQRKLRALLVKENELPEEVEISNNLSSLQNMVDGLIEYYYMPDIEDAVIICNEEGKINGMSPNREVGRDIIFGPFLIVGDDPEMGENRSLTEEQITKFKEMFNEKSIEKTYEKIVKIKLGIQDNYEL